MVLVTLMFSSPAFSKSTKIDLAPVNHNVSVNASGHILFNHIKQRNKTITQVDCWNLQGATGYTVWGLTTKGKYVKLDSFTTNGGGSGSINYIRSGKLVYSAIYITLSGNRFSMDNVVLVGESNS
jgi:hypothetical protein